MLGSMDAWRQHGYGVRLDWGLAGATAIADQVDVAVVVDVLSFTTTLSVALDAGVAVLPYRWRDSRGVKFAREHDAVLAVGRSQAGPGEISLSPTTLRGSRQLPDRIVLPSPNGSTIAQHLAATSSTCLGASLRNAQAVAAWIAAHHDPADSTVTVVASGEHWAGGGLRPAVEDLWGAGAVIDHLEQAGWSTPSPEAAAARAAWRGAVDDDALGNLLSCASGRELTQGGYREDVVIAAEVGSSRSVPILRGKTFVNGA